jgi:hypothetical protein
MVILGAQVEMSGGEGSDARFGVLISRKSICLQCHRRSSALSCFRPHAMMAAVSRTQGLAGEEDGPTSLCVGFASLQLVQAFAIS